VILADFICRIICSFLYWATENIALRLAFARPPKLKYLFDNPMKPVLITAPGAQGYGHEWHGFAVKVLAGRNKTNANARLLPNRFLNTPRFPALLLNTQRARL